MNTRHRLEDEIGDFLETIGARNTWNEHVTAVVAAGEAYHIAERALRAAPDNAELGATSERALQVLFDAIDARDQHIRRCKNVFRVLVVVGVALVVGLVALLV